MPIRLKSVDAIARKYRDRARVATTDYKEGVANPKRDQAEAAIAAAGSYKEAVTAAAAEGRFEKGVRKAGSEKWRRKADLVGAARYAPGVEAAVPDFQAEVTPYLEVIAAVTLPERYPKGDPRNIARVEKMNTDLRKKKLAG